MTSGARCRRRRLSRFGLVVAACLSASLGTSEARADDAPDTVMLTNGGRVRGTVMEEDPEKGTSIKMPDGTVRRLDPSEVKRVVYGDSSETAPAPPPVPPPPAPRPLPDLTAPVPQYRTVKRGIPGLYIAGPIVLGSTWLLTIGLTAALTNSDDPFYGQKVGAACVPVFGPWVLLSQPQIGSGYVAPIVFSGLAQAAGLVMTIAGLAARREVTVPVVGSARFSIAPTVGGAVAIGTF
jgi:hypothetical protein